MLTRHESALLQHLAQYVTDNKKQFIDRVLSFRTRHVTVVLEDIYQSQNSSAVIRTCEGMGLQDVHIIENNSTYEVNKKVLKGANKWLDLIRYRSSDGNNTERCLQTLREQGYRILAAAPAEDGKSITEINALEQKCALMVGNELKGLSPHALAQSDEKVRIPMYGFVESFNVSVSVAISLAILMSPLRTEGRFPGLSDDEKEEIKLGWFRKIVNRSDIIEREFMRTFQ